MNTFWCLTHNSNAEGPVTRCFYALFAEATDRCELAEAEVKIRTANNDPQLFVDIDGLENVPLPDIEAWVNRSGAW